MCLDQPRQHPVEQGNAEAGSHGAGPRAVAMA